MKRKTRINKKEFKIKAIIVAVVFVTLAVSLFFSSQIEKFLGLEVKVSANEVFASDLDDSSFEVTYIDVGEGNSTFVSFPDGKTLLIDGGKIFYGSKVVEFLNSKNITQIDYLIATHSDADHVGGLISVLQNFEVKNIYRPFQISFDGSVVSEDEKLAKAYGECLKTYGTNSKISKVTTETYRNFISAVYSEKFYDGEELKSSYVSVFYDELKITGENYSLEFFAPLQRSVEINLADYPSDDGVVTYGYATNGYGASERENDNSAIFLIKILNLKFLFTGDATASGDHAGFEEIDFLDSLTDDEIQELDSIDVLLAGHHGSTYSTGDYLLSTTIPKIVVISVGTNSYGHPSNDVLSRIALYESEVLRTDNQGNLLFGEIDGNLKYATEKTLEKRSLTLHWWELSLTIFVAVLIVTFSIRPKNTKKRVKKLRKA